MLVVTACALQGPLPLLPANLRNVDLSMNDLTGQIPSSYGTHGKMHWDCLIQPLLLFAQGSKHQQHCTLQHKHHVLKPCSSEQTPASGLIHWHTAARACSCGVWHAGSLAGLSALDLASNQLTGTIAAGLASMPNLQELDLSYNDLSGALPTDWSAADDLILLYLQGNDLTGMRHDRLCSHA